jgi:thiosulfate/3-mercaptopyruvate sulfurtransferase
MPSKTLISATELTSLLSSHRPVVLLDCGFDLADTDAGRRAHATGHLPGARYVHLDTDLAGDKGNGSAGRHPLPDRAAWAQRVGSWGIKRDTAVVAYDDQGGPYAARAWWLLRWLGHADVAVLDGGSAAWRAAGGALSSEMALAEPAPPYADDQPQMPTITADELLARLGAVTLVDARAPERFRGDTEALDKVAGHIPGAVSRFFKLNLQADGRFKPAEQLRAEFESIGLPPDGTVMQCGSGITACHNLLAMAHAGLGDAVLYPGSWSEWCSDPARPVARG